MTTLKRAIYRSDSVTRRWNETRLHHIDPIRGVVREDKYRWLAEMDLRPGVILDVGANYGQSALAIRHHRPDRTVLCIEANPDLQPSLRKLARRDPAIRYVMTAAGDEAGFVELTVPTFHGSQNTGGATLDPAFLDHRVGELEGRYGGAMATTTHTVPVMRLDALSDEIAAVKIDVEGLEAAVIRGLGATLDPSSGSSSGSRPPVFMEVRHSDGEAMRLLVDLGYTLCALTDNGRVGEAVSPTEALASELQDVLAVAN